MLEQKGASEHLKYNFTKHFPSGVVFESQDHAIEMFVQFAGIFDFAWAAERLLDEDARAELEKAIVSARVEFDLAEYEKLVEPARAEFGKAVAIAFARAFYAQESAK